MLYSSSASIRRCLAVMAATDIIGAAAYESSPPGIHLHRQISPCAFRCRAHPPLGSWLSARERSRQPEPWEHAVLEAGHGTNPVAGQGEDVQADPCAHAGREAQVGSERGLVVGAGPHEVESPPAVEDAGAEAGRGVSALILEGHRWHRDENVVR